jgi:hypothetical protein
MGAYVHVAGWLELDDERLEKALAIVCADSDGVGHYTDSWCTQTRGGGYSRHLFFGCTIRESTVDALRAQVSRIASEASSRDGETTDYPEGVFRAVHEDEGVPMEIWRISGGSLQVEKIHVCT